MPYFPLLRSGGENAINAARCLAGVHLRPRPQRDDAAGAPARFASGPGCPLCARTNVFRKLSLSAHRSRPARCGRIMVEQPLVRTGRARSHTPEGLLFLVDFDYTIRYEDLVRKTSVAMNGICRFLKIDMNDRVLTPTTFGKPILLNSSYGGEERDAAVTTSHIGRFPQVLTSAEVRLVEDLLHFQMAACGYAPAQPIATAVTRPSLPAGARRVWSSRAQAARVWKLQRQFAGRSLSFGSAFNDGRKNQ